MRKVPNYENLYHCCEKITKLCTRALKREKSLQDHLTTLRDMRTIIFRESGMRDVYDWLVEVRSELINLLNSENRKALEETLEQTPDVLELYGNNLFLTICAVLQELVHVDQQLGMAIQLWAIVAEWVPYQLGFNTQQTQVRSKYDLQAIHSNLRERTKFLLNQTPSVQKPVTQEYGQLVWSEEEEIFEAWMIFQDEEDMVGGFIKGLLEPMLRPKWYGCVKDAGEQKSAATQASSSIRRSPLISHRHGDKTVLWGLTESIEEEESSWIPFVIEYPEHQYRKSPLLPWFKLSEVPIEIISGLQPPTRIELPPYVDTNVNRFLQLVAARTDEPIKVTVHVSVDTEKEVYVVAFYEKNRLCETLQFKDTRKLVRTLRHPIRLGSGLETVDGQLLMWDHRTDITYIDAKVETEEKKETISLSLLKPLVHRSRFYPDQYQYPKTCKDLLAAILGSEITMVIKEEGQGFKIELEDLPKSSTLDSLETIGFSSYSLGLLTECEELFDPTLGTRHPVTLDVSNVMHKYFPKSDEHSRLAEVFQAVSEWMYEEEQYQQGTVWKEEGDVDKEESDADAEEWDIDEKERNVDEEECDVDEETIVEEEEGSGPVSKMHEGLILSYASLEVLDERVVLSLESEDGDCIELYVVQDVQSYLNDSQYAGAIYPDRVKSEVTGSLAPYDLEEGELDVILAEVRAALEEEGIKFFEE